MSEGSSSDGSSSDSGLEGITEVYTADEILRIGLLLVHYRRKRIKNCKKARNIERFKSNYGAKPGVVASVFSDLQRTHLLPIGKRNIRHLLMAFHTLMRYPTNDEREALFDIGKHEAADITWEFVRWIQALKPYKILWPPATENDKIWAITVDGVHFWIKEPSHPEWSLDLTHYSHKYNKAGLCYELGISLTGGLVWMKGPFRAGMSNLKIFVEEGLKEKLKSVKMKAIADGGYFAQEHKNYLSTPNGHDDRSVKKFKSRALKRHEKFNGRIKVFESLSGRFRHGKKTFASCVEAICVICQYDLEQGNPLYDILIEDII